jgi:hypothetical protein
MNPELRWQPDRAEALCPHGRTSVQAEPGDDRARLEARAIVDHLAVDGCECWSELVNRSNVQALHDLLHERGARCGGHP